MSDKVKKLDANEGLADGWKEVGSGSGPDDSPTSTIETDEGTITFTTEQERNEQGYETGNYEAEATAGAGETAITVAGSPEEIERIRQEVEYRLAAGESPKDAVLNAVNDEPGSWTPSSTSGHGDQPATADVIRTGEDVTVAIAVDGSSARALGSEDSRAQAVAEHGSQAAATASSDSDAVAVASGGTVAQASAERDSEAYALANQEGDFYSVSADPANGGKARAIVRPGDPYLQKVGQLGDWAPSSPNDGPPPFNGG
ncbi:MAG: hypothetical protein AB1758_36720 [Candidatus Eremiobacterota bacterium]